MGLTAQQIADLLQPGSSESYHAYGGTSQELTSEFKMRTAAFNRLLGRMESAWTGDSSDAAAASLSALQEAGTVTATNLHDVSMQMNTQGESFSDVKNKVGTGPGPQPESTFAGDYLPMFTDTDEKIDAWNEKAQQVVDAYNTYQSGTEENARVFPATYGELSGDPKGLKFSVAPSETGGSGKVDTPHVGGGGVGGSGTSPSGVGSVGGTTPSFGGGTGAGLQPGRTSGADTGLPPGAVRLPDGSIRYPDGTIRTPDGRIIRPGSTSASSDGFGPGAGAGRDGFGPGGAGAAAAAGMMGGGMMGGAGGGDAGGSRSGFGPGGGAGSGAGQGPGMGAKSGIGPAGGGMGAKAIPGGMGGRGTGMGGMMGGAGAGGRGGQGDDDKEHKDEYYIKQEMDPGLKTETDEYGEKLVDESTGFTVVPPVIGE